MRLWIMAGLSVALAVIFASARNGHLKPIPAVGGSFRGFVPNYGQVQFDLFFTDWGPRGWMYRDGGGLPLEFDLATNSAGQIEAALLSHQGGATVTNALLVLHLSESSLIATGHIETPSDGHAFPLILTRSYTHQMATERRSFHLSDYSASDEYVGHFPVWGSNTPFLRALTGRVAKECDAEADEFMRTRLEHSLDIVRYGWGIGRDWCEVEHWQVRVLTGCLASFAVWSVPERGGCGNSTKWKGRNYWWDGSKLREIKLQDLFALGSDWSSTIRRYCWHDLTRQEALSPQGVVSGDVGIDIFTLSPTGLQIYFNPYQVGSGADGEFVVHVPYTLIKHLFRLDGPVSPYAQRNSWPSSESDQASSAVEPGSN